MLRQLLCGCFLLSSNSRELQQKTRKTSQGRREVSELSHRQGVVSIH